MKKPTPDEVKQLRELFPKGAPRIDYREMLLAVAPAARAEGDGDAKDERATDENAPIGIAISSEAPVLRYDWWEGEYYWEVLDHSSKSVQLDYCKDGMPFIASHRSWDADQQHGIVENITVDKDRTLRGDVRFSRAERSQQIRQDMVDLIRKKVSVGYIVGDEYTQTEKKDGYPVRRYMAWMPLECSTVPVPADYNVGVGRAQSAEGQAAIARFLQLVPAQMPPAPESPAAESRAAAVPPATPKPQAAPVATERNMPEDNTAPSGPTNTNVDPTSGNRAAPSVTDINERAAEKAQQRVDNLTALANQHGCSDKLADWLRSGASELEVSKEINKILGERMQKPIASLGDASIPARDWKRFSMARALMLNTELESESRKSPGGSKIDFGFERELAQEIGRIGGGQRSGNLLPYQTLGRAGVDSSVSTTGGAFKFTAPGEFIPMLRNKTSVLRAGASVLSGLVGPVTFPKQTSATTAAWSAENPGSDISVTNLLTTTVTLTHKSVGAGTAYSRQMLFIAASGNNDIDAIIQNDLAAVIGLAMDLAALNGTGASNQPTGVLANTSIGTVTLGTAGGTMAWSNWVGLETLIGDANADTTRMGYITNTKQRGVGKNTAVLGNTASSVPIWTGTPGEMDGIVNGYRALASNQVPRNLTKGSNTTVCSAVLFGAFEHLLIGLFGPGFETVVDPFSKKYQGMVEVAAWAYMDVALRYPEAFACVKDAL